VLGSDGTWDYPESPVPRITKINQYGRVEITFSSGIHIAPNMTMIRNGTIEIDGNFWPVLLLEIDPGWDSDPEKHKFDWIIVNQTSTKLILQLYFEDAKYISSNFDREWLKVTFMDPLMFYGINGMAIDEEDRTITREIPPQLGETEQTVQLVFDGTSQGARVVIFSSLALGFYFLAPLNILLTMIHAQQLIVVMPLFNINLPPNASVFSAEMMKIAAFEIIDTKPYLDGMFGLEPSEPLNSNFEAIGFESRYFIHNMGTLIMY